MRICASLNLAGNALEAIRFYCGIFNVKPEYFTYADMPPDPDFPVTAELKDKVMHSEITLGPDQSLMITDNPFPEAENMGNVFSLCLLLETEAELRRLFTALEPGGKVIMPAGPTFWSTCFGMLRDRYGVTWSFNLCEAPEGYEAVHAKTRRE